MKCFISKPSVFGFEKYSLKVLFSGRFRIFREKLANLLFGNIFAENCMKMKEFGLTGGAFLEPLDAPLLF